MSKSRALAAPSMGRDAGRKSNRDPEGVPGPINVGAHDARGWVRWAAEAYGDRLMLLSSMQKTSLILMHLFHELGLPNEVLFVDTGYHFYETLRLRDEIIRKWRLNLVTIYPDLNLETQEAIYYQKLFNSSQGQPECCRLRKEQPLLKYLAGKPSPPSLMNGLRREEGGRRADLQPVSLDRRTGGKQLSPLFDWTTAQVDSYLEKHALPVHPLYAKHYASIGCYPCTTPIRPGEDARAGRWRHLREVDPSVGVYCGINFSDGSGI